MAYTFTDYKAVRALLGVAVKELPDDILAEDIYKDMLSLEMAEVSDSVIDDYLTAVSETTAAAKAFASAFNIFAAYAMASFCLAGMPQFSPKSITDGKGGFSRYAESPFKETVAKITSGLAQYKRRLQEKYGDYSGTAAETQAPATLFAASTLDTDPITGS